MFDTYLDGWLSQKEDVQSDENPFDERTQQRSHNRWLAGWTPSIMGSTCH